LKSLPTTSGNMLADRRADYAEMLFRSGDHAAAAELMLNAMELVPGWALGWFRLGEMYEAAGLPGEAAEAWRTTLKLDPSDRPGAALKLELLGEGPSSSVPPRAFVEALFDQYADTFDASLVGKLGYCVPELLHHAIAPLSERGFGVCVDLGCGTGLMGERLRPLVGTLEGHDISRAMLKKAEAKRVYDRLVHSDLQRLELAPASADLIVAADVFIYVGALAGVVTMAEKALRPGGVLAFSVERAPEAGSLVLGHSRRYAHGEDYVRRTLAAAALTLVSLDRETIRQDRGAAIEGLIVVARKSF